MTKVLITLPKNATSLITPFAGSSKTEPKGFLLLSATRIEFGKGWASPVKRTCLYKGTIEVLEAIIEQAGPSLTLPGKIIVREYVVSEIPQSVKDDFFQKNEDITEDEQLAPYLKTTGGDNPIGLTLEGEPIARFTYYDHVGVDEDVTVAHDNGGEISALRKEQKAIAASFAGAGEAE